MKGYLIKELQELETNLSNKIKGNVEIEMFNNFFIVHVYSFMLIKMSFSYELLKNGDMTQLEEIIINRFIATILDKFLWNKPE